MDAAQLQGLLKSYGAADTPENVNRIRNHYAADPTAADRRLFGAQGQSDESGGSRDAILNAMLDKVMAQTEAAGPLVPAPVVSPMVQNASAPTRRSATAGMPPLEQYGPGGSDPLAREVNRNTPRNPSAVPPKAPRTSGYEVDPQLSAMNSEKPTDWSALDFLAPIISILGAGAVAKPVYNAVGKRIAPTTPPEATFAGPMNKNIVPDNNVRMGPQRVEDRTGRWEPDPTAIERDIKLDNRAPSKVENSPELVDASKRQQTQASIDAANAEYDSMLREQMLQQTRGKKSVKSAVKNVTGRK